jgi:hypothetical protein
VTDRPDGDAQSAPVVLISFNRPDATRRTLERIRQSAPSKLFLIADGPRPGHQDDVEKCAEVRRELESIDWPCSTHRRYSDTNRGVDATIELGLDWVFSQVGEAIILEDDCLPHPDFFRFCTQLLARYRNTDAVWQICGRAPTVPHELFAGASYCFTACGPIWGWATWERAWQAHRRPFPCARDRSPAPPSAGVELGGSLLLTNGGRRYFQDVARKPPGDDFLWDARWSLSVVRARGLVAIPKSNLIENIGFGEDASNTRTSIGQRGLEPLGGPVTHPAQLSINHEVELALERIVTLHHGRTARFVAHLLRPGPVRKVVRTAVGAWREWRVPVR